MMAKWCGGLVLAGAGVVGGAGTVLANPDPPASTDADRATAEARLVAQIHLGETLFRDDLVLDAIDRLFRIAPDHPEGLAARIRLALRQVPVDKAQVQGWLDRLQARAPGTAASREAATLVRLRTSPQSVAALSQARLYAAAGRLDEARKQYDQVFEGVYPGPDFVLEYWQFRARQKQDRAQALAQIEQELIQYPQHAGLLAEAARLSLDRGDQDRGLAYLHRLADTRTGREPASRMEYDWLSERPISRLNVAALKDYGSRYAGLPRAPQALALADQREALLDDPAWQAGRKGMALVDANRENSKALADLAQAAAAYPEDPDVLGALGLAWLRAGDRRQALTYFERARDHETKVGGATAWVSLIASTRYWLLLEQADRAARDKKWAQADALYAQAHGLDAGEVQAVLGLASVNAARGRPQQAWDLYRQSLRLDPGNGEASRGMIGILEKMPADAALEKLASSALAGTPAGQSLRRRLLLAQHQQRAQEAQDRSDWSSAATEWAAAQSLDPDDPWISYRLAQALRAEGADASTVMQAYQVHLGRHPQSGSSRYAQALLLAGDDQWQDAQDALGVIPVGAWSDGMHSLSRRIRLHLARQARDSGDIAGAQASYEAILREDPDNAEAFLDLAQIRASQGDKTGLRATLAHLPPSLQSPESGQSRDLADLWLNVGDRPQALQTLQRSAAGSGRSDPLVFRDMARIEREGQPKQALADYTTALRVSGLLSETGGGPQDDGQLSEATRWNAADDWKARSIRSETAALYQQRNPSLEVSHDYWFRNDGTPGLSRLHANTTIARLEFPWSSGRLFLQADRVHLDAGSLETGADQRSTEWFGSCHLGSLPGCAGSLSQTASGVGVAVGYKGERLEWDVGHSPIGFPIGNWLGGISYRGDLGPMGWRLTLSRRPLSSSVVSYAGARDPRTGVVWGGVVATGPSLGLSWDQGGANGVWADLSYHRLTGTNVADNTRVRAMAGYYRRLINEPDRVLSVGVNAMAWHYQKNLGEYTLGQGGYYSPQRYLSLSLPVRYAWRNSDWLFVLDASVSRSWTRVNDSPYYPLPDLLALSSGAWAAAGGTPASVMADSVSSGGCGGGFGYSVRIAGERRLNGHWVVGAAFEMQKSQDYSPNRAMLYLRYNFEPWKGDLPLPATTQTAYSEYK
ncbi:Cellulose synthase operon protein C [Castellaniella defragrans]